MTNTGIVAKQGGDMFTSFLRFRLGMMTALITLGFLAGLIASLKHTMSTLREEAKQMFLAAQDRQEVAAVLLSGFANWIVIFILLVGFMGFGMATISLLR